MSRTDSDYIDKIQIVVLNTLTSEFVIISNPLPNEEPVYGVHLMNQFVFIYGRMGWCKFDLRGNLLGNFTTPEDSNQWPILRECIRPYQSMTSHYQSEQFYPIDLEYSTLDEYRIIFWSGNLEDSAMLLHAYRPKGVLDPFLFHRYAH